MRFSRLAPGLLLAGLLAIGPGLRAQDGGDPGGGLGGDKGGGDAVKPPNDPDAPLHVRVNQAIDSGVAWLKKKTYVPGNWEDEVKGNMKYDPNAKGNDYRHPAGCTALALYTLLKCGVPPDDPVIVKGFQWLRGSAGALKGGPGKGTGGGNVPRGSYEISATILALEARANPHKREKEREQDAKLRLKKGEKLKTGVKLAPEDEKWMRDLVTALLRRRSPRQGWRYNIDHGDGKFSGGPLGRNNDMSSSQFAMLALLAAERCGIPQDNTFYMSMLDWVLKMQEETGEKVKRIQPVKGVDADDERYGLDIDEARGWAYIRLTPEENEKDPQREGNVTSSMTACGLANVLICASILEARECKEYDAQFSAKAEKAWYDGNAWFQEHWNIADNVNNPGINHYHYYALYCIERVGDLKRVNLIGGNPWYDQGARLLVDEQLPGGYWEKQDTHTPRDVLNTCFALLFLNRATPAITGD